MKQSDKITLWFRISLWSSAWAPVLVFLAHVIALVGWNVYSRVPDFDIPMHFCGGVAIAYFWGGCYRAAWQLGFLGKPTRLVYPLVVIGFTALAAVVWEFAEFLADYFFHLRTQPGLDDTMLDLLMGLLGGLVLLVFQFKKWPGNSFSEEQLNGSATRTAGE